MTDSKQISRLFNPDELDLVDEAGVVSEELVNNFFKMSSGQWLKNRYDIKTGKDLEPHERIGSVVAQVVKYEAYDKNNPFGSSAFSLYNVCLQDQAILSTVRAVRGLTLRPFLVYVLTHELVHVVRFSKYEHRYESKNEAEMTLREERKVHQLTYEILQPISIAGMSEVFDFYKNWTSDYVI